MATLARGSDHTSSRRFSFIYSWIHRDIIGDESISWRHGNAACNTPLGDANQIGSCDPLRGWEHHDVTICKSASQWAPTLNFQETSHQIPSGTWRNRQQTTATTSTTSPTSPTWATSTTNIHQKTKSQPKGNENINPSWKCPFLLL